MKLAVYDMDKTVTRRPTYTRFLLHIAKRRAPWRLVFLPLVGLSLLAYALKLVDRARLKEINHALLIGSAPIDELGPHIRSFAEATFGDVRPGASDAIARDLEEGRILVMSTASYRFYAGMIGSGMRFHHTLGTEVVQEPGGLMRPRILGENNYADAKLRIFKAWLADQDIEPTHIRFYSDHVSDAPMFELADEAVAVNPDPKLAALARERGWRIEDWG